MGERDGGVMGERDTWDKVFVNTQAFLEKRLRSILEDEVVLLLIYSAH